MSALPQIQESAVLVVVASAREDEPLAKELEPHLIKLVRQGQIRLWQQHHPLFGMNEHTETLRQLETAHVILLLISKFFLASGRHHQLLARALERQQLGIAKVLPILVRPCSLSGTALDGLRYLPHDGNAVSSWSEHDAAWVQVAQAVECFAGPPRSADIKVHDPPNGDPTVSEDSGGPESAKRVAEPIAESSPTRTEQPVAAQLPSPTTTWTWAWTKKISAIALLSTALGLLVMAAFNVVNTDLQPALQRDLQAGLQPDLQAGLPASIDCSLTFDSASPYQEVCERLRAHIKPLIQTCQVALSITNNKEAVPMQGWVDFEIGEDGNAKPQLDDNNLPACLRGEEGQTRIKSLTLTQLGISKLRVRVPYALSPG